MSMRQLRARLDRLERSVGETKSQGRRLAFEFPIDPELAKALLKDWERLHELEIERAWEFLRTSKLHEDTPEEIMLRERIAQNAKTINVPPKYGLTEFLDDQETLRVIGRTREELYPWDKEFFIDDLDDIDAEKAQLAARTQAFKHTPEGQARFRLKELVEDFGWKSAAEHEELERLMSQYPESMYHPSDPFRRNAWPSSEELRRRAYWDGNIAEERRKARPKSAT